MKNQVLCVCPEDNADSIEAGKWAEWMLANVPDSDPPTQHVRGQQVSRKSLQTQLTTAAALLYFGHGDWHKLMGAEDLLDFANAAAASGKLIVAVACRSARDLGRALTTHYGALGYLGFSNDVLWLPDDPQDLFRDAFVSAGISLLGGGTLDQAAAKIRDGFDRIVVHFSTVGSKHPNKAWAIAISIHNKRYTVVHGDGQSGIRDIHSPGTNA